MPVYRRPSHPGPGPGPGHPSYAVHGSTLVLARPATARSATARPATAGHAPAGHTSPRPPRERPPRNPYARLFARPGTVAFTLGGLLARLPMGMFTVSAVLMIAAERGSYALAGSVTATGLAATALAGPLVARLVDRYGQARAALPATVLALLGSLALAVCVRTHAPDWTLFAAYAATATTPNTGGMARARWAHLLRDDAAARHTANSFEQAVDELCFMIGPVLATLLCTALFPQAGTLAGCGLLLVGMLLFLAQRSTEPPRAPGRAQAGPAPLRRPGMPALLLVFLATGAVFGALEVVTLAHADGEGHRAAAGAVLACQAAGSALAGLAFGALPPARSDRRRLAGCVGAMAALMTLPLLVSLTAPLPLLAGALLVAGMATAPTMVTGMALVQRLTPAGRLNEGMTLAVTALLGGIAAGSASGGWAVEALGSAGWAYTVPLLAAASAAALATLPAARPVAHG
ncbi:MFS transporter [Streptomyces spirodelae]|uniref:MFS transporter n=1 Tax=Streptomyces spirodelae TaxID=2812904 RepID=A0ABS3WNP5_9ACTN|nr:MFS transporter [Streptomyces spirodelae]MBO8184745.1 MFS transporter [Streptomyces spirodelae]